MISDQLKQDHQKVEEAALKEKPSHCLSSELKVKQTTPVSPPKLLETPPGLRPSADGGAGTSESGKVRVWKLRLLQNVVLRGNQQRRKPRGKRAPTRAELPPQKNQNKKESRSF